MADRRSWPNDRRCDGKRQAIEPPRHEERCDRGRRDRDPEPELRTLDPGERDRGDERAECQAGDECDEHRTERVARRTKNQRQHARPGDFVRECHGPGNSSGHRRDADLPRGCGPSIANLVRLTSLAGPCVGGAGQRAGTWPADDASAGEAGAADMPAASQSAPAATATFSATPVSVVARSPTVGSRTNPLSAAPEAAPNELAA